MDSFFETRGFVDIEHEVRSPSLSDSSEDEVALHHSGSSRRVAETATVPQDYDNVPSPIGSRASRRSRRSGAHSIGDARLEHFLSNDSEANAHHSGPQSCIRQCAQHAKWEKNAEMEEDKLLLTNESLSFLGDQQNHLLDHCALHVPEMQPENVGEGDRNEQREFSDSYLAYSGYLMSPFFASRAVVPTTSTPLPGNPRLPWRLSRSDNEMPADPRTRLLSLVMANNAAGVTLAEMEKRMNWNGEYESTYGPLLEYLQSYQSIFVVSPIDDRVHLRRPFHMHMSPLMPDEQPRARVSSSRVLRSPMRQRHGRRTERGGTHPMSFAGERRMCKPSLSSAEALSAHIGSVSYSCVAERFDLNALETVFHRRGYTTEMIYEVLHVSSEKAFDLFLFNDGTIVWWGMNRKDHWMVDDDFLSASDHLKEGVEHRYTQGEIEALFPIWCSYELDQHSTVMPAGPLQKPQPLGIQPAIDRLAKVLCFDHYLVPGTDPLRSLVMLTFSHSLGRSARVEYFEYVTKSLHDDIMSIPAEFSGLLEYYATKRRVARLEGELAVKQLALQSIHDSPDVLWEAPWLQGYYDMAEEQNTTESRLLWLISRSDTLLQQLIHIKGRRHRLFMLGSDVFLIVLLLLDVLFMTSRLVAKLYFKVDSES